MNEEMKNDANATAPDRHIEDVYAAVGFAISVWEQTEFYLACLFTVLIHKPLFSDSLREYGRDAQVLSARLNAVELAANRYFINAPDQDIEASLFECLREIRAAAASRNQIAHGVVRMIPTYGRLRTEDGYISPEPAFVLMVIAHPLR